MSQFFPSGGQSIGGSGPSSEYSGLISFSMDWLKLLAVHGTLKSLIQHYSLKTSTLWYSAFFMVHLLHPLMISGKTIVLTIQTFAGKAMSPLFSMLLGFSWLFFQGASIFFFFSTTVVTMHSDFGAQENKACHCFHCFSRYLP